MFKLEESRYDVNLIYYYFTHTDTPIEAYKDLENPVVLSIATFRKWNKNGKIHVLDASQCENDWGHWPKTLNFQIHRSNPVKINPENLKYDRFRSGILQKISTVYEHVKSKYIEHHETVIVSDADVFFIQNPLPLAVDHTSGICCSYDNVGYWYFMNCREEEWHSNNSSPYKILELWAALCAGASADERVKESITRKFEPLKPIGVQEEIIFWYIQRMFPHLLIKDIPYTENFWFDWPTDAFDMNKVKNLHYRVWRQQMNIPREEKGKICLCLQEIRDIVVDVIGEQGIKEIFGEWDCDKKFSIHDTPAIRKFLGNW